MVFSESMTFNQSTSDNLNPADSTVPLLKKTDEVIREREVVSIISTQTIGNSWIAGSATNGLVGTNTATQGGGQQVVGGSGRGESIVTNVVSPNNVFRERFKLTQFKDTDDHNTADWDTTNFRLAMSTSSDHNQPYNTIATFLSIFLNAQTIIKATITATERRYQPGDKITYFLSADGGDNWEEFTKNVEKIFTYQGTDLRVKIQFWGMGGSSTYIEDLQVSYVV